MISRINGKMNNTVINGTFRIMQFIHTNNRDHRMLMIIGNTMT